MKSESEPQEHQAPFVMVKCPNCDGLRFITVNHPEYIATVTCMECGGSGKVRKEIIH